MGRKKCPHVETMEKSLCAGAAPACPAAAANAGASSGASEALAQSGAGGGVSARDQQCAVTDWSEWSPCSVSCGELYVCCYFRGRRVLIFCHLKFPGKTGDAFRNFPPIAEIKYRETQKPWSHLLLIFIIVSSPAALPALLLFLLLAHFSPAAAAAAASVMELGQPSPPSLMHPFLSPR